MVILCFSVGSCQKCFFRAGSKEEEQEWGSHGFSSVVGKMRHGRDHGRVTLSRTKSFSGAPRVKI